MVWLRALERFFKVKNLPLSQPHLRMVLERNFMDELLIVGEGIQRARELCYVVMGEERVNLLKFNRYVEEALVRDDERGSYRKDPVTPDTQEWRLAGLLESLSALMEVQANLARSGSLSLFGYKAFGKLLVQSLNAAGLYEELRANPFRPGVDGVSAPRVSEVIRGIEDRAVRRETARLMLGMFRFLRYLELVRAEFLREGTAKRTLLLFVLIHAEADVFLQFYQQEVLKRAPRGPAFDLWDSVVFGTGMEMKKVFQKELVDFAGLSEREVIYIRMEDAHGILSEAFQQAVVTMVQHFEPEVDGTSIFANFVTKRDQSMRVLTDLYGLYEMLDVVQRSPDFEALFRVIRRVERFQQASLRLLMYKDWNVFETFLVEFRSCKNLQNFEHVLGRFVAFVGTLIEEVRKRGVLTDADREVIAARVGRSLP